MMKFIKTTNSIIMDIDGGNELFKSNITILNTIHKFILLHCHYSTIMYKINFLYSRVLLACLLLCMPPNLIAIHLLFFEKYR